MTASPELSGILWRIIVIGVIVGLCAFAVCAIGYLVDRERFYAAYLTAFLYWFGLAAGCMVMAQVHGMTGGAWGRMVRRSLEAGYETVPLFALLFVPIWCSVGAIYPWTNPEFVAAHEAVARKSAYLNVTGFQIRAIVYFAIWIIIPWILNASSPNEESGMETPRLRRLQWTSGMSLVVYGFTFTFASVDWMMSLEPTWYSTMYGVLQVVGQAAAGLSCVIVVAAAFAQDDPWRGSVSPVRLNDIGNLLLASVMFWAYCSYFQFLVIWCGNLPEETSWYVRRTQHGWLDIGIALALLHFTVPFLLLLSKPLKRNLNSLSQVAMLLLVMRYVDLFWHIVPAFPGQSSLAAGLTGAWLDLAVLSAVGGMWIAVYAWRLSIRIQIPLYDPNFAEAVHERTGQTAIA